MPAEPKPAAHKSQARTFRLGAQSEAHIAEIVPHLPALGFTATATDAIRWALAEAAKKVRKNNPKKSPE